MKKYGFSFIYIISLIAMVVVTNTTQNTVITAGVLGIMTIAYILLLVYGKNITVRATKKLFWISGLIGTLIATFVSSDLYYYVSYGVIQGKYHLNPYTSRIVDMAAKTQFPFNMVSGVGIDTPFTYGYLYALFLKVVYFISFGNAHVMFYVLKFINLVLLYFIINVVTKIAKELKTNTTEGLWYFIIGLNPLIINEFLGNGHNDLFLMLPVLMAIHFIIKEKNFRAALMLIVAFQIKSSVMFYLPFVFLFLIKNKVKVLIRIVVAFVVSFIPYVAIYNLRGIPEGIKLYSQFVDINIPLYLVNILKFFHLCNGDLVGYVLTVSQIMFILIYTVMLYGYIKNKNNTITALVKNIGAIYGLYIIVLSPTFFIWYLIWLLPVVSIFNEDRLKFVSIIVALSTLIYEAIYIQNISLNRVTFLIYSILILLLAIIYLCKKKNTIIAPQHS